MSHRAIVALQTGPDSYDIYYSANGAFELSLTEPLKKYILNQTTNVDAIASMPAKRMPQSQRWNALKELNRNADLELVAHNADAQALEPTPMYSGLPLKKVSHIVEFDTIEAFYLVRDDCLETYVPVWIEPDVIRPWCNHLTVKVYHSSQLSNDPTKLIPELKSTDPIRLIDDKTLTNRDRREDRIVSTIVPQFHESIYSLQRGMTEEISESMNFPPDDRDDFPMAFLTTDTYELCIYGPATEEILPSSIGTGLLVRIPNGDTQSYWDVVNTANVARSQAGFRLNMLPSADDEDIREERTHLTTSLFHDYRTRIAPWSPPPYGSIAKQITES